MVRALNIYGWGPYSPIQTITAAGVPSQMQIPVTSLVGTGVRITFVAPSADGSPITAY
jgi:hypothetical protein